MNICRYASISADIFLSAGYLQIADNRHIGSADYRYLQIWQKIIIGCSLLCTAADRVVKQNPIAISQVCSLNVTEYLSLFFISALSLAHCPDHPEMKAICALQYRARNGVSEAASGFCLTTPPAAAITAPLKRKGC